MPLKIYVLEQDGKLVDEQVLLSDKEESMRIHKSVYKMPDCNYTQVKPIKEKEGYDRYFVDNEWEYREKVSEQEQDLSEEQQ